MDNMSMDKPQMKLRYKFLDESVWQRLNQAISVGAYIEDACVFAGISSRQFRRWRELAEQGVEPYAEKWEEINKSESQAIVRNLFNIQNASNNGTWQASAWLLERKYPDKYGKKDTVNILDNQNNFDVELYWSDGNKFVEGEVVSEMSDTKKTEEDNAKS
jgi:transposase